jgi:hypothetical protein
MADEPTSGAALAAAPVTPPAQAAIITSPDALAADGNTTETISLDEARKLRKENQTLRGRQKAIDDAKEAADLAALSATDKLNKQHADLQAKHAELEHKYKERVISAEVQLQAANLGIRHPEKVFRLIDTTELEFDDDGMPKNAKALVEKLLKEMPELGPEPKQEPAAQTANRAPQVPAMNPGRSSIASPGANQPGKVPSLFDRGIWKT